MINISTTETDKMKKNVQGSRRKFPGKREILKPQISRPDFPGKTLYSTKKNDFKI